MFRTDLLPILSSLNTVFTTIDIGHASYFDCLLARSGLFHPDLASRLQHKEYDKYQLL